MTQQIAAVAAVFALLAATLWLLRRKGAPRRPPTLEVMESRPLGPGHALHLVRVGDRVLVLAAHASGCTLLDARPAAGIGGTP